MFKFKFQKALDHKKKQEDLAAEDLRKKQFEKTEAEDELKILEDDLRVFLNEYENLKKGRLDINTLRNHEMYLSVLKNKILKQNESIEKMIEEIKKLEEVFLELRKERKTFEKLKEKYKETYDYEEKRDEQKLIDELSNNMYNRRT